MHDERKSPNEHVLVIDDSEEVRTLVTVVLGTAGYQVSTAGDAAAAVEKLKGGPYAVVILDFKMPHDGIAMIDFIGQSMPDILARTVVLMPSVNRPIFGVLPKPFDLQDLVRTVAACASRS